MPTLPDMLGHLDKATQELEGALSGTKASLVGEEAQTAPNKDNVVPMAGSLGHLDAILRRVRLLTAQAKAIRALVSGSTPEPRYDLSDPLAGPIRDDLEGARVPADFGRPSHIEDHLLSGLREAMEINRKAKMDEEVDRWGALLAPTPARVWPPESGLGTTATMRKRD